MPSLVSNQLDAFTVLAKTLHFSEAAKQLHITQSALSQRIHNLEDELGVTLIIRDRHHTRLTEIGERLLRYCQNKAQLEANFIEELQNPEALGGTIRIAGFSSINRSLVIPALGPLLREHDNLRLELYDRELHEVFDLLRRSQADYVFSTSHHDRDEIASTLLGHEHNVLVESRHYKCPEIFLDHDQKDETTIQYFKKAGRSTKKLKRRYLDEVYSLIDGVRHGVGKAVLPRHLIADDPDLKVIQPKQILKIPIYLHYYKQNHYGHLHAQILDALTSHFTKAKNLT